MRQNEIALPHALTIMYISGWKNDRRICGNWMCCWFKWGSTESLCQHWAPMDGNWGAATAALDWQVQEVRGSEHCSHGPDLPCLSHSLKWWCSQKTPGAMPAWALHRSMPSSADLTLGIRLGTLKVLLAGWMNPPLPLNWLKLQFEHSQGKEKLSCRQPKHLNIFIKASLSL